MAKNQQSLSKIWLVAYNQFAMFTSAYILLQLVKEGDLDSDIYTREGSPIRETFQYLELSVFIEFLQHLSGLTTIRRHLFINMLVHIAMPFGVI